MGHKKCAPFERYHDLLVGFGCLLEWTGSWVGSQGREEEVGRGFGWPQCRMSRLKYAHFCKWHFSRTALSLIDIIWWNLCTDTKAKALSALNSMDNRYFSCLKTLWAPVLPFLLMLLLLLGPILRFVDASWAIAPDVCSLLSAIRHSPSAVCCMLHAACRLWLSEVTRFAVSNCASIVCQVVSFVGVKFASRNSGSWSHQQVQKIVHTFTCLIYGTLRISTQK